MSNLIGVWKRLEMPEILAFYKTGNVGDIGYEELAKSMGVMTSDMIPEMRNPVYGPYVWRQLNMEQNIFAILPKLTWPRSGWRVQTAFSTDSKRIAIGESDNIPEAVFPALKAVYANPKLAALTFEVSEVLASMSQTGDDVTDLEYIKLSLGQEFTKMVNRGLGRRVIGRKDDEILTHDEVIYTRQVNGQTYNVLERVELEALDRIVSSFDEVDAFSTDKKKNVAVNIYNIKRANEDGSEGPDKWANATVKFSEDGQELTDELIREALMDGRKKGAFPSVMITGYSTYAKLIGLYTTLIRYMGDIGEKPVVAGFTNVKIGIGGVERAPGVDAGIEVASVYGIPIVTAVDTPSDGDGFLERVYILDTTDYEKTGVSRFGISVLRPVEYFETNRQDFALLEKFAIRGLYRMIGETTARFLPGNVKLRDLLA